MPNPKQLAKIQPLMAEIQEKLTRLNMETLDRKVWMHLCKAISIGYEQDLTRAEGKSWPSRTGSHNLAWNAMRLHIGGAWSANLPLTGAVH